MTDAEHVAMLELVCEGLATIVYCDWPADWSLTTCAQRVDINPPTPEQIAAITAWEATRR